MATHEIPAFENSQTVRTQKKKFFKKFGRQGILVEVRWDDECRNGHNTFAITGSMGRRVVYSNDYFEHEGVKYSHDIGGCIHDEIAKHFPELEHLIKWHLVNSNAPMYYFENSQYWAKQGNMDHARGCAVWPEAEASDILDNVKMMQHLSEIMPKFKADVESLGFIW